VNENHAGFDQAAQKQRIDGAEVAEKTGACRGQGADGGGGSVAQVVQIIDADDGEAGQDRAQSENNLKEHEGSKNVV